MQMRLNVIRAYAWTQQARWVAAAAAAVPSGGRSSFGGAGGGGGPDRVGHSVALDVHWWSTSSSQKNGSCPDLVPAVVDAVPTRKSGSRSGRFHTHSWRLKPGSAAADGGPEDVEFGNASCGSPSSKRADAVSRYLRSRCRNSSFVYLVPSVCSPRTRSLHSRSSPGARRRPRSRAQPPVAHAEQRDACVAAGGRRPAVSPRRRAPPRVALPARRQQRCMRRRRRTHAG